MKYCLTFHVCMGEVNMATSSLGRDDREKLIKELKSAVSGDLLPDVGEMRGNHYVASTGTWQVHSDLMSRNEVDEAIRYFTHAEKEMQNSELDEKKQKAKYCRLAVKALEFMQEEQQKKSYAQSKESEQ